MKGTKFDSRATAIFYIRHNLENAFRKFIMQTPNQTDAPSHIYMLVRNICTVHIR